MLSQSSGCGLSNDDIKSVDSFSPLQMIRLLYSDRDLPPASLKGMASPELAHQQGYGEVQGCCVLLCAAGAAVC